MKKFFLLIVLLAYPFLLFAENTPIIPYVKTCDPIQCCWLHDFEIPREIATEATRKAYKIGLWRYLIAAPPPSSWTYSTWTYSNTYSDFRTGFNWVLDWEDYSENWDQVVPIIQEARHSVTAWLMNEYNLCLQHHQPEEIERANAHYQRALIYCDQGDTWSALNDMHAVMNIGESSPEMQLALGQAYNDANLFLQAIEILSELIEREPDNQEAYFERAQAYFEMGDFSKSIEDYLASSMRPTLIPKQNSRYRHLKFSLGIGTGILNGGCHSVYDFAPSLLSTFYGLGNGLWAFASNPIGLSVEFVEAAHEIIQFVKANATVEIIANLIPELKEYLQKWDNLDDQTKGYYLGYIIGHYGVDCLIWQGSLQAVKAFQRLKRANMALTFETACLSPHQAEEILASSKKFWQLREEYKAKCYLSVDKQNKHIRGCHNFKSEGSEITISLEKLEVLAQKKLGQGIPEKGLHLGEVDYKEIVNFGEEIGIVLSETGVNLGPTTWGKIHYDNSGGYHIVPHLPIGK